MTDNAESYLCRQELVLLDNEIVFNEAIIEEREQGIKEIQSQIGQVNEIFMDLAVLTHEQGVVIGKMLQYTWTCSIYFKSLLFLYFCMFISFSVFNSFHNCR